MRVGHLVDKMCRSNSWFFYRVFTNPAANLSHAVFCNRRVNPDLFPHPRVQSRSLSLLGRDLLSRRLSSSLAGSVERAVSLGEWRRFIRRYQPDVLHAQDGKQAVQWLRLIESTALPLIVTFHGSDINRATYDGDYLAKLERLFSRSSRLHFVSYALCERAIELGAEPEKCMVVHLGTPVGEATKHSNRTDDCVFGIAANLVPCKGHETLLLAFSSVVERLPGVRLCVWGDGPLRHRLQWLAHKLGLAANIEFFGQIGHAELQGRIRNETDVVLLPSQKDDGGSEEGLPMSLCEAAAAAVPCIATDCGGISELISNGETGVLLSQRAEADLAEAMFRLARNPSERKRLGIAAREKVTSQLNLDNQLQQISRMYAGVLQEHASTCR